MLNARLSSLNTPTAVPEVAQAGNSHPAIPAAPSDSDLLTPPPCTLKNPITHYSKTP